VKRLLRAARCAAALLVLILSAPTAVRAQDVPDMQALTLTWSLGNYIAPVICSLPGGPMRVARKANISPPRKRKHRLTFRLEIDPMGTGEAHCTNELGDPEPEIQVRANIYYDGPARPDTARRDFQQMMRRDGGVPFRIESGQMLIGAGDAARTVSLKGAELEIRPVPVGSDAARMLGSVGKLAKRTLILEVSDGTRIVIHAVHVLPKE
jgi:hypothetical protein